MTVDAVNSDIFDDDKITGIVCVWFVGEKLERVRFDHRAVEHAQNPTDAEADFWKSRGNTRWFSMRWSMH